MTSDESNLIQSITQDFDDMLSQEAYRDYLLEHGREEEAEAVKWLWFWKKRPQGFGRVVWRWYSQEDLFDSYLDTDPRSDIPRGVWERLPKLSSSATKVYDCPIEAYKNAVECVVMAVRDGWKMWEWEPKTCSTEMDLPSEGVIEQDA